MNAWSLSRLAGRPLVVAALLVTVCGLVYGGNLADPFVSDDVHLLRRVPPVDPNTMFGVDTQYAIYRVFYRPLTCTIFWLNIAIFGQNPVPLHVEQLTIYVLACWMMYLVLRRVLQHDSVALLGALVFAVHPTHVQPVVWIADMADTLLILFGLLAIWQWLRWLDRPSWFDAGCTAFWLAAALASKETAVVIPVLLALLCWHRKKWPGLVQGAVVLAPWLLYAGIRAAYIAVQDPNDPHVRDYMAPSHFEIHGVIDRFWQHWQGLMVAPDGMWAWPWMLAGFTMLAAAWLISRDRRPAMALFGSWTIVSILPTLGYYDQRYAAWPSISFVLLICTAALALREFGTSGIWILVGLSVGAIAFCLGRTYAEANLWGYTSQEFEAIADAYRTFPRHGPDDEGRYQAWLSHSPHYPGGYPEPRMYGPSYLLLGIPYSRQRSFAGLWNCEAYEYSDSAFIWWMTERGSLLYYQAPTGVTLRATRDRLFLTTGSLRPSWNSVLDVEHWDGYLMKISSDNSSVRLQDWTDYDLKFPGVWNGKSIVPLSEVLSPHFAK